jgi:DNA-binding beta-propeller fold protein YncE
MSLKKLLLSTLLLACAPALAEDSHFYRLEKVTPLKGAEPGWDYVTLDAARQLLFLGRRDEGVTVFDIAANAAKTTIENSKGANHTALIPEVDRGYTTNEDGSSTVFQLSTLKTIDRIKLGEDADAGFYEPVTKQIVFTQGDSKAFVFLDAKSGKILGKLETQSSKLDGTVPDGKGNLFTAERDRNSVLKVDAKARKVVTEWKTEGCEQPTGIAFDTAHKRLFVGCRTAKPVLLVMDSETGKPITSLEIGRGNDGVIYDAETKKIYTSNGVDGNLVIIDQVDADTYKLEEAVTTRPSARTMALDPKSKKIYLITAEGVVDPAKKINKAVAPFYPNKYFDDSFVVLTYARQ